MSFDMKRTMKTSVLFTLSLIFLVTNGELLSTIVNLENESSVKPLNFSTDKPLLRYGFQKTRACKDYSKAFLCITKCLDLNFDVAYSDKNCKCTCYSKPDKAKCTTTGLNRTRWRDGAPTTSKPMWAQDKTEASEDSVKSNEEEATASPDNSTNLNDKNICPNGPSAGTQTADAPDVTTDATATDADTPTADADAPAEDADEDANTDAPAADADADSPSADADADAPAEDADAPAADADADAADAEADAEAPAEDAEVKHKHNPNFIS